VIFESRPDAGVAKLSVLQHVFDDVLGLNPYPGKNKIIKYGRPYDTSP
jgi:hypothetical protein